MKLQYFGQSCFSVEVNGTVVLFDPFITPNELAKGLRLEDIRADYILVSHGHFDHTADCVALARQTGATVVASWEVANWMAAQGVEKTHPMNTGGQWRFPFGTVRCTHAVHSSSMPDGSYGGSAMGFLVTTDETCFYYSGDTALTIDMQLVPRWGRVQFAVLPIGDNFTMGYEDALAASEMIGCRRIVGVHYDTFGYIKINHQQVNKAFADAGVALLLPAIGESIEL